MAKRSKKWRVVALCVLLGMGALGYWAWHRINGPATKFTEENRVLYIATGAHFQWVVDSLKKLEAITDEESFRFLCERKKYPQRIRPGRYRIARGMSMNALVNMLRAGEQEPVRVTFSNIDHLPELAGRLGRSLEPDSIAFLQAFLAPSLQEKAGLSSETVISLFIPNTYEFWWTTTPAGFIERMRLEHEDFWDQERRQKARAHGLSPAEVATLASIVQAETMKAVDAPQIAGVYLNRLRIGMPLQADPTLKFALGLDTVNRILDRDKDVVSPYNTYKNRGLPPGPINMPEPRFIDAVLDAPESDYLYFCARADLSGHSDFARTYEQHLVNARRYQRALNERKIYR
ncbi:MAG: endolytic transglycosylase MltG [Flavobacteriales bacterium]|nr:endolytic transglycosylase MltG [Flavobacteriales bacterium]